MATQVVTREMLLAMHNDIQDFKSKHPGLASLRRNRLDIEEFYNGNGNSSRGNGATVQTAFDKITKLQHEYCEFTDDEKPKIKMIPAVAPKKAVLGEDGSVIEPEVQYVPEAPVMKEGKLYADFDKAFQELMEENVNIYL